VKQIYRGDNLKNTTYQMRPMYASIPKFEGLGGRNMPVVNIYANAMGRSADFATAQSNATAAKIEDFLITRVNDYSVATVSGEAVEASQGDKYAFLSAMKVQIDTAANALADSIETHLPRAGDGSIGTISSGSTVTNQTITLDPIQEVSNFEPGMTLQSAATATGATRTGTEILAGVNRVAGILTATSAQWDTVCTAIAASDLLFVEGDANNATANVKMEGFASWFPAAAPASTAFFSVDRTADSRLYGQFHSGTTQPIEEALIDGGSLTATEGGSVTLGFMHHAQQRKLVKQIGSKVNYQRTPASGAGKEMAAVGFKSVRIMTDNSECDMVAANKCQPTIAWMLEKKTCLLASLGQCVKILNTDGQKILRQSSLDGYEVRLGSRHNFASLKPNHNVRVTLASP